MILILCMATLAALYNNSSASILSTNHKGTGTDLQVTSEERGSFGFGHHSDLLEGQEVMDVDVVLCRRIRMERGDELYAVC